MWPGSRVFAYGGALESKGIYETAIEIKSVKKCEWHIW